MMDKEFRTALFSTRFLFITVPLFALSTTALFPLLALELESKGFSQSLIGIMTSVYYLGAVVGAFSYSNVVRRFGQKGALAFATLLAAASTVGVFQTDSFIHWIVFRFVTGYALGAYYIVMDSWVSGLASKKTRGRLHALYEALRVAATALGPLLLLIGEPHLVVAIIGFMFALSFLPSMFSTSSYAARDTSEKSGSGLEVLRCFPFAVIIIFCAGMSSSSFYALGAVFAKDAGATTWGISSFIGLVLVAPAVTSVPIGAISDRTARMTTALGVSMIACLAAIWLATLDGWSFGPATSAGFLVGGCMVTLYALGMSRMVDALPAREAVDAAAVALIAYNAGSFSGPVISGTAMHYLGNSGLYTAIAGFALVASIAASLDYFTSACCSEKRTFNGEGSLG